MAGARVWMTVLLLVVATLSLIVSAAENANAGAASGECKASTAMVQQLEAKVAALEQTNTRLQKQLGASSRCDGQLKSMEEDHKTLVHKMEKLQQEKQQLLNDMEKTKTASESQLQTLMQRVQEGEKQLKGFEKRIQDNDKQSGTKVKELTQELRELQSQKAGLEQDLTKQKQLNSEHSVEIRDAKETISQFKSKIANLQRELQTFSSKNEALRNELDNMESKLTMAALLSSYYDESILLVGKLGQHTEKYLAQAHATRQLVWEQYLSPLAEKAQYHQQQATLQATQLYNQHLAATLNPVLLQVQEQVTPLIVKYEPVARQHLEQVKLQAVEAYHKALEKGLLWRAQAIQIVQQHETLKPFAQKIVDAVLGFLTLPLLLLQARLLLRLVFFLLWSVLYLACCCCCCGCCRRNKSPKSKKSSNSSKSKSPALPAHASKKTTSAAGPKKDKGIKSTASLPASKAYTSRRASGKKK